MLEQKKLSKEDQEHERQPFRPWRLLGVLWVVVSALGIISWYIGKQQGYL
jgi:hypothetical protein